MFLPAYAADDRILGMPAALCRVAQGPAAGALLNQRKRLEMLRVDYPSKHEEGGL
jgi:hypothetical protein